MRSAVVAVALAAVGNLLTSGDQSSQLLALLTPTFVALAVAVGGAQLLRLVGRTWTRRTASSGGTAAYLAARRLSRRQDVANLMLPLLLAASVLTFATATTATSDDWRVARARAEVGAARTFVTDSSPGRLLDVTRRVDPGGRYLAAAVTNTVGDDMSRSVFVDTSRLRQWSPGTPHGPTARSRPCSASSRPTTGTASPSRARSCWSTSATCRCAPAPASGRACGSSTSTGAASRRT